MHNISIILALSMYMYTISFILVPVLKGMLKTFVQHGVMEIPRSSKGGWKIINQIKIGERKVLKVLHRKVHVTKPYPYPIPFKALVEPLLI